MTWIARIPERQSSRLATVRRRADLEVMAAEAALWLRGGDLDRALELQLHRIPGATRYELLPGGLLRSPRRRVPGRRLPAGRWVPVARFFPLQLDVAALGGAAPAPLALRLERSAVERPARVLRVTLGTLGRYIETAAAWRLQRLSWTASVDGEALLWGDPLPPLAGRRYHEDAGIATRCGWAWSPPVDAAVLARIIAVRDGELIVFDGGGDAATANAVPGTGLGGYWRIEADRWISLSRSAVRRTLHSLGESGHHPGAASRRS